MNAPTEELLQRTALPIDRLLPSPTNPRTRRGLDRDSLMELAESIKSVGLLQPIIVRQHKDSFTDFEIICGERRWRAATFAGLEEVPVRILDLTDEKVVQMQLAENIQRTDLDELEEAEGYARLMQLADADGKPYTAERIAELMGVSKGTIYGRLKLMALCQEGRDAFIEGKIDASRALLIARIPVHTLQIKALADITDLDYSDEPMSYRTARDHIQNQFMTDLKRATFDTADATLLPKAGACTDCLKCTGNAGELFDDVGSKDVCIDQSCFAAKKLAHIQRIQAEAEARGDAVILAKDAKQLVPNKWQDAQSQLPEHGYAPLDSLIPNDPDKRTWSDVLEEQKLLGGKRGGAVQRTVIENPNMPGTVIETVNIEAAVKALREAGYDITTRPAAERAKRDEGYHGEEYTQEMFQAELSYREQLMTAIRASIIGSTEMKIDNLVVLAEEALWNCDRGTVDRFVRTYTPALVDQLHDDNGDDDDVAPDELLRPALPSLTPQQLFALVIEALLDEDVQPMRYVAARGEPPALLLRIAAINDIDAAAIKKNVATKMKAAARKAAKGQTKTDAEATAS